MDLQLIGKKVFISGSTSGIGLCVAKIFLEEGAEVYINGRENSRVLKVVSDLKEMYPESKMDGFAADFSKEEEVKKLIDHLPSVDILINNVGIYSSQSFFDTSDAEWMRQFEVNVMAGVRLSRAFLLKMLEKNWGRIIFVSSECASLVPQDLIAYSTTKAAILAVSRGLSQLTKGSNVTVNSVLPGSTGTEGAKKFISELAAQENKTIDQAEADFFKNARPASLLQRFASEEEIARTIVYYASPLASATNGAAIKLDGGSMGGII